MGVAIAVASAVTNTTTDGGKERIKSVQIRSFLKSVVVFYCGSQSIAVAVTNTTTDGGKERIKSAQIRSFRKSGL
jgi:hypothetical protein